MRGLQLLSLSILMPTLALAIQFTNPPPYDGTKSYSTNSIYEEGSLLHIKWSAKAQNNTSLTLWQLNGSQFLQPFEYITRKSIPSNSTLFSIVLSDFRGCIGERDIFRLDRADD
jgi:hypothetical protein